MKKYNALSSMTGICDSQMGNRAARTIFRRRLLRWYDCHKRDLPWRRDRDPYRVWLSEIMLQQTRVAAVTEYYHRFLQRFPAIGDVAAAPISSLLAAWSGLGYYRRARMLHAAARKIVVERKGIFPQTSEEWRSLPGIGRYTAAAIASIAFGEAVALVDGNVERVLQRVLGRRLVTNEVWRLAQAMLDRRRPGDFNQALMELGATVCLPGAPNCSACPLLKLCATKGSLPNSEKEIRRKRDIYYALSRRKGAVFLVQRPASASLMPAMWELPEISVSESEAGRVPVPALTLRHSITVTDYKVHVAAEPTPRRAKGRWVACSQLPDLALTGLARKILKAASIM